LQIRGMLNKLKKSEDEKKVIKADVEKLDN
jgi:hypothetical protein